MTTDTFKEANFDPEQPDSLRVVRLSGNYTSTATTDLVAKLYPSQIHFYRRFGDRKPRHTELSAQEADVFVEAWMQYKADRLAAALAEEKRQQAVIVEAYTLAAQTNGGVTIQAEEGSDWIVRIPAIDKLWSYVPNSDVLLATVKEAIKRHTEHQAFLQEQAKLLEQAHVLATSLGATIEQPIEDQLVYNLIFPTDSPLSQWTSRGQDIDWILRRLEERAAHSPRL